jgi:hypothetical protein
VPRRKSPKPAVVRRQGLFQHCCDEAAPGTRYWGVEKIRALYEATYFAGLRKAGVPEE